MDNLKSKYYHENGDVKVCIAGYKYEKEKLYRYIKEKDRFKTEEQRKYLKTYKEHLGIKFTCDCILLFCAILLGFLFYELYSIAIKYIPYFFYK